MPSRRWVVLTVSALLMASPACSSDDDAGSSTTSTSATDGSGPPVAVTVEGPITGGQRDLPYNAMPEGFEAEYDYREEEWFLSGIFTFERGEEAPAMKRMRKLLSQRVASQPLNQPNAGSVFRNPPGDFAARLIESCSLKGVNIGGAQVSPRHANFIVNAGGATAADIEQLMELVQTTVRLRTGVELVREVRVVGKAKP